MSISSDLFTCTTPLPCFYTIIQLMICRAVQSPPLWGGWIFKMQRILKRRVRSGTALPFRPAFQRIRSSCCPHPSALRQGECPAPNYEPAGLGGNRYTIGGHPVRYGFKVPPIFYVGSNLGVTRFVSWFGVPTNYSFQGWSKPSPLGRVDFQNAAHFEKTGEERYSLTISPCVPANTNHLLPSSVSPSGCHLPQRGRLFYEISASSRYFAPFSAIKFFLSFRDSPSRTSK